MIVRRPVILFGIGVALLSAGCTAGNGADGNGASESTGGDAVAEDTRYESIEDLRAVVEAAGFECDAWEMRPESDALEAATCRSDLILAIHEDKQSARATIDKRAALLSIIDETDESLLGANWEINCPSVEACEQLRDALGGEVVVTEPEEDESTEAEAPLRLGRAEARSNFVSNVDEDSDNHGIAIEALEDLFEVESVDQWVVADDGSVLTVSVTSDFSTDEYVAEVAWAVAREVRAFWSDDFWEGVEFTADDWWPRLDLTVNSRTWSCPGEAMRAIAQRRMSEDEWHDACGR